MARSKTRRRRNRFEQQTAAVEQLETRRLLTGQVTATVENGNVTITGDAEANELELTYFKGDISLRSRAGTRINGQTGRTVLFAGTDTIPGNVTVKLAEGKDTFIVTRDMTIGGNLVFAGGIANDTFGMLGTTVNGNLKVVMGTGRDGVSIDDIYVGGTEAIVRGNNGKDSFHIEGSRFVPGLSVETGKGDDDLAMQLVRTDGDANIETGEHNDHVSIVSGRFKAGLRVVTSKGDDTVKMLDTRVATTTLFGMGADNDQLSLGATGRRNIFVGDFTTNGSGGSDTYEQRNNIFKAARTVERFEEGEVDESGLTAAVARAKAVDDSVVSMFLYRIQNLTAVAPGVETAGGVITRAETTAVSGETTNDAMIEVDLDDDGQFDDLSLYADEQGAFEFSVDLATGENVIGIQTTDAAGNQQTFETMVHRAVGTVVRFDTSLGFFDAELLDEDAPLTVANYLAYVDSDTDAIVHRAPNLSNGNDFVIQGGGFEFADGQLGAIDTNDPVENEFNPANSNVRGTISTALSNSPDSATNQWFVNLDDNSFLDANQHVVFGRVIGTGMEVADAIAAVPIFNFSGLIGPAFGELPLRDYEFFENKITGSVSTTLGSTTLTGDGTAFTQELEVDQLIRIRENETTVGTFRVESIESDTELTLSSSAAETVSGADLYYFEFPDEQNYVFSDIEELLIPS